MTLLLTINTKLLHGNDFKINIVASQWAVTISMVFLFTMSLLPVTEMWQCAYMEWVLHYCL